MYRYICIISIRQCAYTTDTIIQSLTTMHQVVQTSLGGYSRLHVYVYEDTYIETFTYIYSYITSHRVILKAHWSNCKSQSSSSHGSGWHEARCV